MNQCANARAASLERCKRMAQSPLPPPLPSLSLSLLLPWFPSFSSVTPFFSLTLSFSPSNCYLPLIFTITAMFTFHFSLTHLFFSLTPLLDHPSPVLLSYLFISFCDPLLYCTRWCHHFYFLPPCAYSSFPELSLTLYPLLLFSKKGKRKRGKEKKKCLEKRKSKREMKIEERGGGKS